MRRVNRRIAVLIAGSVIFYLLALAGTFVVVWRSAAHKTEATLDYAVSDLQDTINEAINVVLANVGSSIVDHLGEARPISCEEARRIIDEYNVDELAVVDRNGLIVGSSDPATLHRNMSAISAETAEFMVLTNGTTVIHSQPLRSSSYHPEIVRKYLGYAFPGGNGYIQVGYDETRLARTTRFTIGEFLSTWKIGEDGFYLCVDAATSRVDAPVPGHPEALDARLAELGIRHRALPAWADGKLTFVHRVFGRRCFCRRFVFARHNLYCVLPAEEFYGPAFQFVLVAAAVLLIVFFVFGYIIGCVVAQHRRIAEMRKAEDERREKDLAMAKTIQLSSLPVVAPPIATDGRFRLFARMDTAKEVGGDFYDFYMLDSHRVVLVIADVSGKGVPGALFMMRAKATLKAKENSADGLAAGITEANAHLSDGNDAQMFVTCWTCIVDLRTGEMQYVNAGHNPPRLRHADGTIEPLAARSGLPLASLADARYRGHSLVLRPGDTLLLYTDGVTEAQNRVREQFGETRLDDSLRSTAGQDVQKTCDGLFAQVVGFADGAEQADDITMLAFSLAESGEGT